MYGSYQRIIANNAAAAETLKSDRVRAIDFTEKALAAGPHGVIAYSTHGTRIAELAHSKGWVYPLYHEDKIKCFASNLDADQIRALRSLA